MAQDIYNELSQLISDIPDESTRQLVQALVDKMQEGLTETSEMFQELESFVEESMSGWGSKKVNLEKTATKPKTEWLPGLLAFLNKLNKSEL